MAPIPPFCPRASCPNHHDPQEKKWYKLAGFYETRIRGTVRRYVCQTCGKSFSTQTFHLSYYVHKNINFKDIQDRLSACSGIRAAARHFGVTDKVITNRLGRLARQAMAVMAELRRDQDFREDLVADGFESYAYSQYGPNNVHLLVGNTSQYLYAGDNANLRRKGRMTEKQKARRKKLEETSHPLENEINNSFTRICHDMDDLIKINGVKQLGFFTDRKREYLKVLIENKLVGPSGRGRTITHNTTSSKEARTFSNPLWGINYYDRELRKDQANHVRETTRWSKSVNNSMERLYLHAGYHNFFKPYRIKGNDPRSHAEVAGFDEKKLSSLIKRYFTRRFFFTRLSLNVSEWRLWLRSYQTPFVRKLEVLPAYVTCRESHLRGIPGTAAS